jgi:hypothetical protein
MNHLRKLLILTLLLSLGSLVLPARAGGFDTGRIYT